MTPDNDEITKVSAPLFDSVNVWFEKIYEPTMFYMLRFDGRLDEKLLKKAVLLTINADPYLSSRYAETEDDAFWERMPQSSFKPYFTVQSYRNGLSDIFENPPRPLDVRSAPQLRLDLYRYDDADAGNGENAVNVVNTGNAASPQNGAESRGDILVFVGHHGFADAHGIISMGSAVMDTYIRLAKDPDYVPKYRGRYPRDTKSLIERFSKEEREEAMKTAVLDFKPNWSFVRGDVNRDKAFDYTKEYPRGGGRFSVRTISPENFAKIKAFGKRNGATINDLIICSYLISLLKSCKCISEKESPKSVLTAGDLRRYYGRDTDNPMNLAIAFDVTAVCDENTPVKAILPEITARMNGIKNGVMGLGFLSAVEQIRESGLKAVRDLYNTSFDEGLSKSTSNPVFSNIGILDTRVYDTVPAGGVSVGSSGGNPCECGGTGESREPRGELRLVDALFMPVISHAPGISVIASTYKDSQNNVRLTLISGYEAANTDRGRVDALLKDIEERLIREAEEGQIE